MGGGAYIIIFVTVMVATGIIDLSCSWLGTHQNGFPSAYARSRARGGGDAGRRLAPTRRTGPGPVRGRARPRVSGGGHRDNTNTPILYNNKTPRAPSCRIIHAVGDASRCNLQADASAAAATRA